MPPAASKSPDIFISYRRSDSGGHSGRLFEKLSARFGSKQVFMDTDHIKPGEDFVQVIEDRVGSCQILITVISRDWLLSADGDSRRLDDPNDFVRLEIAAALKRDIRVIPVLVGGAAMPKPQDLPPDLAPLTRRHAIELSDQRWQHDISRLIDTLEQALAEQKGAEQKRREVVRIVMWAAAACAVLVAGVAAVWWLNAGGARTPNAGQSPPPEEVGPAVPEGMVYVPGGEFKMGRDDGDEYEKPAHFETVQAFFIGAYEVTCGDYEKFVKEKGHASPQGWKDGACPAGAARKPVTGVNWYDADAFCRARGQRLPTDAEWEFAARGTDGRRYPWGNEWRKGVANANGASNAMAEVGSYPEGKSPFGAFDMVGNAWEWTASDMKAYPGGKLSKQRPETKVLRGGAYLSKTQATATYRLGWRAREETDYEETGFRCVKDAADGAREREGGTP